MKRASPVTLLAAAAITFASAPLHAGSAAAAPLESRLAGARFEGIYMRAGTPYAMDFGPDGSLRDSAGRSGRWWVDERGLYCREWHDGPMAGVATCMEVVFHLGKVAIFSGADKVLEGEMRAAQ